MKGCLAALLLPLTAAGCLDVKTPLCGQTLCPEPLACASPDVCVRADLLVPCMGKADGDSCESSDGVSGLCQGGRCVLDTCGDGRASSGEACDGDDLGEYTCQTFGFYDAEGLSCTADCGLDVSGCAGTCGDGEVNGAEVCDGDNLNGKSCKNFGFYYPDGLQCDSCFFDVSACTGTCGDGVVDDVEYCEDQPPPGDFCTSFGFGAGQLGCSGQCAADLADCRFLHWRTLSTFTTQRLNHVLPVDDADGKKHLIAVGVGGSFEYDGAVWSMDPFVNNNPDVEGMAVWGLAPDDLWAATKYPPLSNGVVMRFDGSSWTSAGASPVSGGLYDIWGTGDDDVWAVGHGGAVLHWDGSSWSQTSVGSDRILRVRGRAPDDVYALSWFDLYHYDGTGWQSVGATPAPASEFRDMWFDPSGDLYASRNGEAPVELVGTDWVPLALDSRLAIDQAVAPSTGRLVGTENNALVMFDGALGSSVSETGLGRVSRDGVRVYVAADNGRVLTSEGSCYSDLLVNGLDVDRVQGAWASSDGAVFAAGSDVARWDGQQWSDLSAEPIGVLYKDAWGFADNDVFAVGASGTLTHFDGGSWTQIDTGTSQVLYSVWGRASDDVYVAGNNVYHYVSGTTASEDFNGTGSYYAVDGTGDRVFAAGSDGYVAMKADGTWSEVATAGSTLRAVCAVADDDVWAFGDVGSAVHFDGSSWTAVVLPTSANFDECVGFSSGDVFALGEEIWRWNGQRFNPVVSPFETEVTAAARTESGLFLLSSFNDGALQTTAAHLPRTSPW